MKVDAQTLSAALVSTVSALRVSKSKAATSILKHLESEFPEVLAAVVRALDLAKFHSDNEVTVLEVDAFISCCLACDVTIFELQEGAVPSIEDVGQGPRYCYRRAEGGLVMGPFIRG